LAVHQQFIPGSDYQFEVNISSKNPHDRIPASKPYKTINASVALRQQSLRINISAQHKMKSAIVLYCY